MRKKGNGGERIVLEDGTAEVQMPGASTLRLPARDFVGRIQQAAPRGLDQEALPDNVKYRVDSGSLTVFVVEFKPAVHSVQWIADDSPVPFGPRVKYRTYRLAMPYVILVAPFESGRLLPTCQLFFRPVPLAKKPHQEVVYFSNLLNVSPNAYGCVAWLCTQYLGNDLPRGRGAPRNPSMTEQIDALAAHAFGGVLNRSSEMHEGKSCFQQAIEAGIDGRVTDPARWQEETEKDASFILTVEWQPAGVTVGQLIDRQLAAARSGCGPASTSEIVNLLLRDGKGG
jgi:hypothetical protein